LIFTGALDLQKIWERVLRRADLKVAYTQGFNPGPRINLASALPLGVTAERELADFWFSQEPDLEKFCEQINLAAPSGLRAIQAETVPLATPALQTRVDTASYSAGPIPMDKFTRIPTAMKAVLESDSILRERRGKSYDLRPLIISLATRPGVDGTGFVEMQLSAREGATGRADEVLAALGLDASSISLIRHSIQLQP
jgi:radical SAM-linked protein